MVGWRRFTRDSDAIQNDIQRKVRVSEKKRDEHKQIQAAIRERADKKFQEAFEQNVKENSFSIDADLLEQRSKDMEASRIIYAEETKKNMEDYRNEPLLRDEQSDGKLHQMMNQAKDTDEWKWLTPVANTR